MTETTKQSQTFHIIHVVSKYSSIWATVVNSTD